MHLLCSIPCIRQFPFSRLKIKKEWKGLIPRKGLSDEGKESIKIKCKNQINLF